MALNTAKVYRCLEKKTYVLGFEIVDLFLVFTVLAALSFILGSVPYKFALTWGPAMALGLLLRWAKAGKPDNFIVHFLQFHFSPGTYCCFPLAARRRRFISKQGAGL